MVIAGFSKLSEYLQKKSIIHDYQSTLQASSKIDKVDIPLTFVTLDCRLLAFFHVTTLYGS